MGKKKKSKNGPFKELQGAATGMAGLAVTTSVGAGIAARAPAGTPSLSQGFNTIAGFAPVAGVAVGGGAALKAVRGFQRKTKKRKRRS